MDANDRQQDGPQGREPESDSTADRPQERAPGFEAPPEELTPPDGGPAPRRLLRARDDRMIGGLCAGVARYFGVDPTLVRVGAVVLALFGGAGVLLYVAGLLLVPAAPAHPGAPDPPARGGAAAVIGVVVLLLFAWPLLLGGGLLLAGLLIPLGFLVAAGVVVWWLVAGEGPSGDARDIARRAALGVGVLLLCGLLALAGAGAAAAGGGTVVAVLVILAGLAVLAGAFARPLRWLVLPAIVFALSAGTVSAAGVSLDGGVGERDYRPGSVAELRERYELGMGQLAVDLRDADLPEGDTPLRIELGVGEALVVVPDDVCVATRADVGIGAVQLFGRDNGGIDVQFEEQPQARAGARRLVVDADIGVGALRVGHDDDFPRDRRDFRPFNEDEGVNTACADEEASATR